METMQGNSRLILGASSGVVAWLLAMAPGCADGRYDAPETRESVSSTSAAVASDGPLRGELATTIATYRDGRTKVTHYLQRGDERIRLELTGELDLAPGTPIEVVGSRDGRVIRAASVSALAGVVQPALADAGTKPSRKMAV